MQGCSAEFIESEAGAIVRTLGETKFLRAMAFLTSDWRGLSTAHRASLIEAFGYYIREKSNIRFDDTLVRAMRRLNRRTGWAPPEVI